MTFNQMQFTGIMFLFLYLLPTICFSPCRCLGLSNYNGEGATCADGFCYVNKRECRAEGFEVRDTTSNAFTAEQKAIIGIGEDWCQGNDREKEIRTNFCQCVGRNNGNGEGATCANRNWCYVNKKACQHLGVAMHQSESGYLDPSVLYIGDNNCQTMEHTCEPVNYDDATHLARILPAQVDVCRREGINDLIQDNTLQYYVSRKMYNAHRDIVRRDTCQCEFRSRCSIAAPGQVPWCIVNREKCREGGFLSTPLENHDIVAGNRADYGRSQAYCKVIFNRYANANPN